MKACIKCLEVQPLTDFYTHPRMADGHLNKCKSCAKADAAKRYADKRADVLSYERERAQRPERRQKRIEYMRKHRRQHPDKARARSAVASAIRDGRMTRKPCSECGTSEGVQAHHHDYATPLDVVWVCFVCHRQVMHGQKVGAA